MSLPTDLLSRLLLAAAALTSSALFAQLPTAAPAEVGLDPAKLEAALDLFRNAAARDAALRGALIVVVKDGKIVVEEPMGWYDVEARQPFTRDTLLHLASNTKAYVSAAAQLLVEEGKLSWDDPVGRWIPDFAKPKFAGMTVGHLASHTSGLPRGPIFLPNVRPTTTLRDQAARFANRLELLTAPGAAYQYSNVGYNVLGAVVEAASGQDLGSFLRTRIFQPLGMTQTYCHETEVPAGLLGPIYRMRSTGWERVDGSLPRYPIIRASGGLISSTRDQIVWMQTWIDGGRWGGTRLLSEDSVSTVLTARTSADDEETPSSGYGYGWRLHADGSFSHGGSDGTFIWANREHRIFALMFTQSPTRNQPRTAFSAALDAAIVR